jgi:hypothetical protein
MSKESAVDQLLAAKAEIDEVLTKLAKLSADHFGAHADNVTWAEAGDAKRLASLLRQACDMALGEGEYAREL